MQLKKAEKKLDDIHYDSKLFHKVYRLSMMKKVVVKEGLKRQKFFRLLLLSLSLIVILIFAIFYPFDKLEAPDITSQSSPYRSWVHIDLPKLNQKDSIKIKVPDINAKSILIYRLDTNEVLYEKNVQEELPIASLTKLVTAIISLENLVPNQEYSLDFDFPQGLDWSLGLKQGDTISKENLLKASMISSFNDSAYALSAVYGQEQFLALMNEKVDSLNLENTNFTNSTGLDLKDNYSSAQDLLVISRLYLNYPTLTTFSSKLSDTVEWVSAKGEAKKRVAYSTNILLGTYTGVEGLKTGQTGRALQCLITHYVNKKGDFLIILLGSNNRFADTRKILPLLD